MPEIREFTQAEVCGEQLTLLAEKAVYWEKERLLLIADLHLGKGNHFRKHGVPIPSSSSESNWEKLERLFQLDQLQRVVFLGDLFHSNYNEECAILGDIIASYPHLNFELVIGNHDILDDRMYEDIGLKVYQTELVIGPFIFTHEPLEEENEFYNLAGHIHPGIRLKGKGRQSLRLPCFYFGKKSGILPAFGALTGLQILRPKKSDQFFYIISDQVEKAN